MARTLSTVAQARVDAGYTLAAAAKLLNLAPESLRAYERRGLPDSLLESAAILYGCSSDRFFYSTEYLAALHQAEHRETPALATAATGTTTSPGRGGGRTRKRKRAGSPILELV